MIERVILLLQNINFVSSNRAFIEHFENRTNIVDLTSVLSSLSIITHMGFWHVFPQFMGVLLTVRYRNQKDPRANPSAFL